MIKKIYIYTQVHFKVCVFYKRFYEGDEKNNINCWQDLFQADMSLAHTTDV